MAAATEFHGNVIFMGLARAEGDRALLASLQYQGSLDAGVVTRMLHAINEPLLPAQPYAFGAGECEWYVMEDSSLLHILCVRRGYPPRCAHQCLDEMGARLSAKLREKAATALPGKLSPKTTTQFKALCGKFDDLEQV